MPHSKEWREKRIAASKISSFNRRGIPTGRKMSQDQKSKILQGKERWKNANPEKARENSIRNLSRNGSTSLSGENHPSWRGGITSEWQKWKSKHGKDFEIWRKAVYARDGKKCRNCGSTNKVQAHHLVSVSEFRQFAFLEMNGVCLCFDCHKQTDSFGGKAIGKGKKTIGDTMAVMLTIPHKYQAYNTVGNWDFGTDGSTLIFVSEMNSPKSEILIAVHELVEASLCKHAGISPEQVTEFDVKFELDRSLGRHGKTVEPGDDKNAPYKKQHKFSTNIEKQMCLELGLSWRQHEKNCE